MGVAETRGFVLARKDAVGTETEAPRGGAFRLGVEFPAEGVGGEVADIGEPVLGEGEAGGG